MKVGDRLDTQYGQREVVDLEDLERETTIGNLNLPWHVERNLYRVGLHTVFDVTSKNDKEVASNFGIGPKTIKLVRHKIDKFHAKYRADTAKRIAILDEEETWRRDKVK